MNHSPPDSNDTTRWPPAFHGGVWVPLVFIVAISLWAVISNTSFNWLLGPTPSTVADTLWNIPSGIVQAALVLLVLRYEAVQLRDIGFGGRQLRPALVAVAGFLVTVNVVVAGLILLGGGPISVAPFALYRTPPLDYSVAALVASGLAQYVFVGPVEELAFRGYLQNKLTDLIGRGSPRLQTATAIVATAVIFALLHVPTLVLVEGTAIDHAAGTLLTLALSGITFGTIYALTHNLVLVAFLHGIGNLWPLVVNPGLGAWPNWGIILVLYGLIVVLYRRWTPVTVRSSGRATAES